MLILHYIHCKLSYTHIYSEENLAGSPLFPGIFGWRVVQLPAIFMADNPEGVDWICTVNIHPSIHIYIYIYNSAVIIIFYLWSLVLLSCEWTLDLWLKWVKNLVGSGNWVWWGWSVRVQLRLGKKLEKNLANFSEQRQIISTFRLHKLMKGPTELFIGHTSQTCWPVKKYLLVRIWLTCTHKSNLLLLSQTHATFLLSSETTWFVFCAELSWLKST